MDDELLTFGRKVERHVADTLRRMYFVMSTGDLPAVGGLGPRLTSDAQQIVMADLQIFGPRHGWLEVKYKAKANLYRIWNVDEHGINRDKWQQYLALRDSTRLPFYLLICEGSTGEMLM